jgi:hypothetical protein
MIGIVEHQSYSRHQFGVAKLRTHNFMLCRIHTYQVIEEIKNWMVKDIEVSFFVKCIEAHLQSKYSANFINELWELNLHNFQWTKILTIMKQQKHMLATLPTSLSFCCLPFDSIGKYFSMMKSLPNKSESYKCIFECSAVARSNPELNGYH